MPHKTITIKENEFEIWYHDMSMVSEYINNSDNILKVKYCTKEESQQEIISKFISCKEEIFNEIDNIVLDNIEFYKHFIINREFLVQLSSVVGKNLTVTEIVDTNLIDLNQFEYYHLILSHKENMTRIWDIGESHGNLKLANKLESVRFYLSMLQPKISEQSINALLYNYDGGYKTGLSN